MLLPASRKAASDLIMPNTSCVYIGVTLPCVASGRWIVSFDPDAVTICCSFVPANWPSIACVTAVGCCIVKEYKNMFEVVAIVRGFCALVEH